MDPTGRNESPKGIWCVREQGTKEIVSRDLPSEVEARGGRMPSGPSLWQILINRHKRFAEGETGSTFQPH